jgi:hypothetical protein
VAYPHVPETRHRQTDNRVYLSAGRRDDLFSGDYITIRVFLRFIKLVHRL